MPDYVPYDYSKSGLPRNPRWEKAAAFYHYWVTAQGFGFSPQQIDRFMEGQPVAAAKRLLKYCPDAAEETVTLALLGESKGDIAMSFRGDQAAVDRAAGDFGPRAIMMMMSVVFNLPPHDAAMAREMARMQMVSDMSMMEDQIGDDRRWDKHHDVRWNMVRLFEKRIGENKGVDAALEKLYADRVAAARKVLERIDRDRANKPKKPSGPG